MRSRSAAAAVALLLCGCASADFRLTVDLYDEDASLRLAREPLDLDALTAGVEAARQEAARTAETRTALARHAVTLYRCFVSDAPTPGLDDDLAKFEGDCRAAAAAVEAAASHARDAIAAARSELRTGPLSAAAERAVLSAAKGVADSRAVASGRLHTRLEQTLLDARVSADIAAAARKHVGDARVDACITDFDRAMAAYAAEGRIDALRLGPPLAADGVALRDPGRVETAANRISTKLSQMVSSPPLRDESRKELQSLLGHLRFVNSQLERLQDAGDPVWRIVTDGANEAHWSPAVAHDAFSAEGNTSVVIVRDNALNYRIQRGTNDPAVLVAGQLAVARVIANTATQIAGAAMGVPAAKLPGAAPKAGDGGTQAPATPLAARRATTDEQERSRASARDTFVRDLQSVRESLRGVVVPPEFAETEPVAPPATEPVEPDPADAAAHEKWRREHAKWARAQAEWTRAHEAWKARRDAAADARRRATEIIESERLRLAALLDSHAAALAPPATQ